MSDNLKERTAKGIAWGAINNGTVQVLNLVFGIFLARILSPDDFGIVGVLAIFSAIATTLQTGGFFQGLINLKSPTARDYNSVFWFNILVSLALYALLFALAPLIARFFHQPCLTTVSRVLFLSLPVNASGLACGAYLVKNMMNREIAVVGIVSLVASGVVGILMALGGMGYWSLVGQQMAWAVVVACGRYRYADWRPTLAVDFGPARRMFGFCVKLMITNMVHVLNFHVLTFIFGRLLPIRSVGYYSQANKWNNMAKSCISEAMGQIAQTVLVSVSGEHERELRVFRKMMRFTAFLSFPALFGLALVSREFLLLTIGDDWADSVPLLQLLCIGGAFSPFYTLYQNLVISKGRSDLFMWCSLGQMLLQIAAALALWRHGMAVVVFAHAMISVAWLSVWQVVAKRLAGVAHLDVLRDVAPFMVVALAVMVVVGVVTSPIHGMALLLGVRVVLAALLYGLAMHLLRIDVMEEALRFVSGRIVRKSR